MIQLYIDDFGTGYSSLSYIQRYPISAIKIDRTFINQIGNQENGYELVQSILRFIKDLGLVAVAEGVETAEQFDHLKNLLCTYGQGFFIAKPMDADSVRALLKETFVLPGTGVLNRQASHSSESQTM